MGGRRADSAASAGSKGSADFVKGSADFADCDERADFRRLSSPSVPTQQGEQHAAQNLPGW